MTYQVTHQNVPFNYSDPGTIIIEADSPEGAFATAYDHLARRGGGVYASDFAINDLKLSREKVRALGVPDQSNGRTHIREIIEYRLQSPGRVL